MNKENCALKLVDEIILYYDARSKKHKKKFICCVMKMKRLPPNRKDAVSLSVPQPLGS